MNAMRAAATHTRPRGGRHCVPSTWLRALAAAVLLLVLIAGEREASAAPSSSSSSSSSSLRRQAPREEKQQQQQQQQQQDAPVQSPSLASADAVEKEGIAGVEVDALGGFHEGAADADKGAFLDWLPHAWRDGGEGIDAGGLVAKSFRDVAAAENFTARDYFSVRGAVLALTPEDGDPSLFPMCEAFKIGNPLRLHCLLIGVNLRLFTRNPPDVSAVCLERQALPVGGLGFRKERPPHELKDIGVVPEFIWDKALIAEEKPVYYWMFRQILNMYAFTYRWSDAGANDRKKRENLTPLLPEGEGYADQMLMWIQGPSDMPFRRPFGQCFTYKGPLGPPQLICAFRGTIYGEEWLTNYRLHRTTVEEVEQLGLTGLSCKGQFSVFQEIIPEIQAALAAHPDIKEVTLTGHSLGGSMSLYLALYMGVNYPDHKLNVVAFGAPNIGDAAFLSRWNRSINIRQISYVGSGLLGRADRDPTAFGLGDMVCQLPPDCVAASPCPLATMTPQELQSEDPDFEGRYRFARAPGFIMFYAHDMPNSAEWRLYEDYFIRFLSRYDRGLISSHMCSYQCFVASAVGDPETRCFFPEQGPRDPLAVCDLLTSRSSGEPPHGPGNDP